MRVRRSPSTLASAVRCGGDHRRNTRQLHVTYHARRYPGRSRVSSAMSDHTGGSRINDAVPPRHPGPVYLVTLPPALRAAAAALVIGYSCSAVIVVSSPDVLILLRLTVAS